MPPVNELITINIWAVASIVLAAFVIVSLFAKKLSYGLGGAFYALCWSIGLSFWFWVFYIAIHFISKYW